MDVHQKRFVKIVEQLSHGKDHVLRDFCEMSAISLANALQVKDPEWDSREKRYLEIVKRYKPEELSSFAEMLSCVVNSLCDGDEFNFHDCLGELHMSEEITGRSRWDSDVCFTPKDLARCMAKMTFSGFQMPEKGYLTIGEPACGAGSMVIQACAELKELGVNFQKQIHVTAVELRPMLAHMAYIQFSLLHIPAVVIHGNSLSLEEWSRWKTPAHVMGLWDIKLRREAIPETPKERVDKFFDGPAQQMFDFQIREKPNGEDLPARRAGRHAKGGRVERPVRPGVSDADKKHAAKARAARPGP